MSTHKHIDKICLVAVALGLVLAILFSFGESLGLTASAREIGYESRIFDRQRVHTVDIVMDDWDSFIATCTNEEYATCTVVVDGEAYKNIAIRAKGNTSLSSVRSMNSNRYSFKIEFDHYDNNTTYYGLDKLCLNNVIQDNSYMKDYLAYTMMYEFGAPAPLCSFTYVTVNGEDWGLYLAVEAIEDSFMLRNYNSAGELYKPDSMNMGGGRGNGKDFKMEDIEGFEDFFGNRGEGGNTTFPNMGNFDPSNIPNMGNFDPSNMPTAGAQGAWGESAWGQGGNASTFPMQRPSTDVDQSASATVTTPQQTTPQQGTTTRPSGNQGTTTRPSGNQGTTTRPSQGGNQGGNRPNMGNFGGMGGGFGGFGMGGSDAKLQYIDDNPSSYSTIFGSAKTDANDADKARLIASLKSLSSFENLEEVLDIDAVLSYFVVHIFVDNGDSYTGSMIHNYYLHEENGALSMIPWDYNLAYGTFQGSNAKSSVNSPIDTPTSGSATDRPMVGWIFSSEEYTELYHEYYRAFIEQFFDSGWLEKLIDDTVALISPYVEKDPSKFCTYEQFLAGAETIKTYCLLRAESVKGQLDGTIPSTSSGQSADSSALIDTGSLNISSMGTMGGNRGGMGGMGGNTTFPNRNENTQSGNNSGNGGVNGGGSINGGGNSAGTTFPNMGNFDPSNIPNMGNFDPSNMPTMNGIQPRAN